jgi:hypothetical protein
VHDRFEYCINVRSIQRRNLGISIFHFRAVALPFELEQGMQCELRRLSVSTPELPHNSGVPHFDWSIKRVNALSVTSIVAAHPR